MRRRVLLPLLLFGLLAVCAVLLPVGDALAQTRTQELQTQRAAVVDQILQRTTSAMDRGDTAALDRYLDRLHEVYGEGVIVVDGSGRIVAAVGEEAEESEESGVASVGATNGETDGDEHWSEAAGDALRGVPRLILPTVYPWSADTAHLAEPVLADGSSTSGAVVLAVDLTVAKADILGAWLVVAAIGIALLLLLLAASLWWTGWVLRPVLALDAAANALAEQRAFEPAHATGPPELRRLAGSFERMALSVGDALEQQRSLVADTSHQLRNPLAAVRLRIDSLAAGGNDDDGEEELEAVGEDLDRLERMVDRLLTLASVEHRAGVEHSSILGPTAAEGLGEPDSVVSAAELADPHRESLAAAGIGLETFGEAEHVMCRRDDLEEIVEILIDNARKYAGSGARVRIGLERSGDGVELVVSDSGGGLSDDEIERIGTRFWRADAHREQPGSGLGYAIVEQLARGNRAELAVDHAPEGGLRTRLRMRSA